MDTAELRTRNRIVAHDCTQQEWADLESHFARMGTTQLLMMCNRFRLEPSEDWRTVLDGVRFETWDTLIPAYEQITGRSY